ERAANIFEGLLNNQPKDKDNALGYIEARVLYLLNKESIAEDSIVILYNAVKSFEKRFFDEDGNSGALANAYFNLSLLYARASYLHENLNWERMAASLALRSYCLDPRYRWIYLSHAVEIGKEGFSLQKKFVREQQDIWKADLFHANCFS
ncbi:MAG: hypothetical protein AAFY26_20495, partial [Cyanobacteria bacterium J06638_22]